jgi:hypothetical protein
VAETRLPRLDKDHPIDFQSLAQSDKGSPRD